MDEVLFQVVNVVEIPGQWLKAGDVFDVYLCNDNKGKMLLHNDFGRNCSTLNFSCFNIHDRSIDEILGSIRNAYTENTFELCNPYVVTIL